MNLAFGDFPPEGFRILLGMAIEVPVAFHALDVGFADELFTGGIDGLDTHRSDCNKTTDWRNS